MQLIYFTVVIFFSVIGDVHAYVGPGLGLGAIGAFVGVVISVFLAIVGFIWYPIRRMLKKRKMKNDHLEDKINS